MKNLLFALFFMTTPLMAQNSDFKVSVHILDVERGQAAAGIAFELFKQDANGAWTSIAEATSGTSPVNFLDVNQDNRGTYKVRVYSAPYFRAARRNAFFPYIDMVFSLDRNNKEHFHFPILLTANNFTTYRGS